VQPQPQQSQQQPQDISDAQRVRFLSFLWYPVAEDSDLPSAMQSMLMQVLSLTQEQINALPENERATIQQLVSEALSRFVDSPTYRYYSTSARNLWAA